MATIDSFTGVHSFLSNFYVHPLMWEGTEWKSSEHAFNASKTLRKGEREWVREAETPIEAKRRGRTVNLRPDWDKHWRYVMMYDIIRCKFEDDILADRLVDTHDDILVEGNTWHDGLWGVCRCANCPKGRNCLGIILMQRRYDIVRERGIHA